MVTGGRVLNYLEEFISHPETTVIIVGYQGKVLAVGNYLSYRGKIYGKYYPVLAKNYGNQRPFCMEIKRIC
jgi:metallo-beta-lactamase family protein